MGDVKPGGHERVADVALAVDEYAGGEQRASWPQLIAKWPRQLDEERRDEVREHNVERARAAGQRAGTRPDDRGDVVGSRIRRRCLDRQRIRVDGEDVRRTELRGRYRQNA